MSRVQDANKIVICGINYESENTIVVKLKL